MKHSLIPARNAQIGEALRRGVDIASICDLFALGEARVRQIATEEGIELPKGKPGRPANGARQPNVFVASHTAWKPDAVAQQVLDVIGWDLDAQVGKRPRCSDRDAIILNAIVGTTVVLDVVGKQHGVTRERIRQIVKKHTGLAMADLLEHRHALRDAARVANGTIKVKRLAADNPKMTVVDLARESGLASDEVAELLGIDEVLMRRQVQDWVAKRSDEEVLEDIRAAAEKQEAGLSHKAYDRHRREGSLSAVRILQRFGTWKEACAAAGVEPGVSMRPSYTRRWTEENLIDWTAAYLNEVGVKPSYAGFDRWLRQFEAAPSAQTARNQVSQDWNGLLELAAVRLQELADGAISTVVLTTKSAAAA